MRRVNYISSGTWGLGIPRFQEANLDISGVDLPLHRARSVQRAMARVVALAGCHANRRRPVTEEPVRIPERKQVEARQ